MDEGVEEDMMGKDSLAVAPPKKEFKVYKMMENVCSGESFLFFTFHPNCTIYRLMRIVFCNVKYCVLYVLYLIIELLSKAA